MMGTETHFTADLPRIAGFALAMAVGGLGVATVPAALSQSEQEAVQGCALIAPEVGAEPWVRTELFFGLDKPDGTEAAEVLAEALVILAEPNRTWSPKSDPVSFPMAHLSPREREVLALVAEGRSNKAIAEALFVSPNTVKTHVALLLNKLHAQTRAQLVVVAARQGLGLQEARIR